MRQHVEVPRIVQDAGRVQPGDRFFGPETSGIFLGVRRLVSLFLGRVDLTFGRGDGLLEAEVELESIEPGDRGIDAFGLELGG